MAVAAQTMVDAIEAAMVKNPGVLEMSVDGRTVRWASLEERRADLEYWKARAADATADKPPGMRLFKVRPGAAQ